MYYSPFNWLWVFQVYKCVMCFMTARCPKGIGFLIFRLMTPGPEELGHWWPFWQMIDVHVKLDCARCWEFTALVSGLKGLRFWWGDRFKKKTSKQTNDYKFKLIIMKCILLRKEQMCVFDLLRDIQEASVAGTQQGAGRQHRKWKAVKGVID